MAVILKIPTENTKGVIVFTNRDDEAFIKKDKKLQNRLEALKKNWVFGIHNNWHNHKFKYNSLYDFHIAGNKYLKEINNTKFTQFCQSAANFVPNNFSFSNNEKMWDILYIAKAVNFKKIPDLFEAIRKLYDSGKMYRVLFIAPVPPQCKRNFFKHAYFCDIRKVYNEMFTREERKLFNLLTLDYEYPFPFDLDTLAHFYKSSRIFVFSSDDEMRPRTVGYAISTGMPIVVRDSISYLLPDNLRKEPYLYLVDKREKYPEMIEKAIEYTKSEDYTFESMEKSMKEFNNLFNINRLRDGILETYEIDLFENDKSYSALNNLDIRIARHHGFGHDGHSIGWHLESLLNYIEKQPFEKMLLDINEKDFEKEITKYEKYGKLHMKSLHKEGFKSKLKSFLVNLYNKYSWFNKSVNFIRK